MDRTPHKVILWLGSSLFLSLFKLSSVLIVAILSTRTHSPNDAHGRLPWFPPCPPYALNE